MEKKTNIMTSDEFHRHRWKLLSTKLDENYTNQNNIYILQLSYASWRTLLVLKVAYLNYLNEK